VNTWLLIPWFKLHGIPVVGKLEIQPFGILVAIGILLGTRVAEWRAEKTGVDPKLIADFLMYTIGIGLLSAYLLNKPLYDWDEFVGMLREPKRFFETYMGLSSYAGFGGGVAAAFLFRHRRGVTITSMGDLFCFAFPFAWFFGRMGCFTVHDHPGTVSTFFLAVDNYNEQGLPRHDLGLYEVIWSAVAVGMNLWLAKRTLPRGFFMAFIPLIYAPVRFFLDYLREVPLHGGDVRYFGLTPGQYGSILMCVAGLLVWARISRGPTIGVYLPGREPAREPSTDPTLDSLPAPAADHERKKPGATRSLKKRKK
jgi:phosphatidylglycerol:prolipoprotein diacylglycerol transferase